MELDDANETTIMHAQADQPREACMVDQERWTEIRRLFHEERVSISEIGVDLSPFPSDRHLTSWSGICPGHHESAGKRQSGKTRKGTCWLRAALIEAALGAIFG
jgi:transposase